MDSFILCGINTFPELVLNLLDAGKSGDMLKAKNLQEKLSSAVLAIIKHGKYYFCIYEFYIYIVTKN